jgi:hypothetical protein
MSTEELLQAIAIELRSACRPGWTVSEQGDLVEVAGPQTDDFDHEVWRLAEFVAYAEFVSIECLSREPREFRLVSRSGTLRFEVRVVGK